MSPLKLFKRRRPLHVALSALMIGLIVVFYLLLATFQFHQGSQRMLANANQTFGLIGRHTAEVIRNLTAPAEGVIALLAASELPTSFEPDGVAQWLRLLATGLRQNPRADAMYVAFGDGSFILLRPLVDEETRRMASPPAGAHWLAQVVDRSAGSVSGRFGFYDEALSLVERRPMPAYRFDPRERAWYRSALAAAPDTLIRTPPYVYFTTREVGLTLARRHRRSDVVVGIDVGVATLSDLLQQERITPSAELAIVDPAGRLVAYSDPRRLREASGGEGGQGAEPVLPKVQAFGVPVLTALLGDAAAALRPGASGTATRIAESNAGARALAVDGRDWFYRIDPVSDGAQGEPLHLVIAAPRDELLADAIRGRWMSVLISLVALALMLWIVLVVVRAVSKPLRFLARDAEAIERFELDGPDHPGSLITEVDDLARAMRNMKHTLRRFLDIGSTLSSESNFDRLLDRVLRETVSVARARGGVIRLVSADGRQLEAAAARMGNDIEPVTDFPPLRLDAEGGTSAARRSAREGRTVIAEKRREVAEEQAYYAAIFERLGVDRFQVLALPLKNRKQELVGTLELSFTDASADREWQIEATRVSFIEALSGTAAVAIDNQRLLMEQKALLQSFIELVAGAIDAKSPYTGGHCQRVPELTKLLARAACDQTEGPFADYRLSEEQWEELHIAAWLHDCGKVTTPEYVVDKATKLETLCDRIHEVRMRFEVLKRDAEIGLCRDALAEAGVATEALDAALARAQRVLDEEFAVVAAANEGGEFMDRADIERLREIGARTWQRTLDDRIGISHEELARKARSPAAALPATETVLADKPEHVFPREERDLVAADNPWGFKLDTPAVLFNRGELHNLTVARGTLTPEDRYKINDHMVQTIKMLAQLPFPRHLLNVPEIAGGHHEKMDGTGYPRRLGRDQLSVSARMMGVADVFEALTAADRPYKRGKTLSESLQIMAGMSRGRHIDPDVFALFLRSGVYLDYARRHMRPEQIDGVDIDALLARPDAPAAA